jgi:hypothetical protein
MSNEITLQGHYTPKSGEVIMYSPQEPLWLAISKKHQAPSELRKFIQDEGIDNLPELRGVAFWNKEGKRADFIKNVVMIFDNLAAAERDEGIKNPTFHKAFFDAFMDNKDFYWFSPAHVKLAIQRGMNGHYNAEARMYGNKLTIRHLIEWMYCFQDEWFNGVHSDYQERKAAEDNAPAETPLKEFLKTTKL